MMPPIVLSFSSFNLEELCLRYCTTPFVFLDRCLRIELLLRIRLLLFLSVTLTTYEKLSNRIDRTTQEIRQKYAVQNRLFNELSERKLELRRDNFNVTLYCIMYPNVTPEKFTENTLQDLYTFTFANVK